VQRQITRLLALAGDPQMRHTTTRLVEVANLELASSSRRSA
jgi:hypothetical protein